MVIWVQVYIFSVLFKNMELKIFLKTILFQCSSLEEMNQKEAELVNEEFVKRYDTYNVIVGGHNGSWQKIHVQGLHKLGGGINAQLSNKAHNRHIWSDFLEFINK